MPLGFDDDEVECPICGGVIWGRGQKVIIEGAKLTVCDSCAQHGEKVQRKKNTSTPNKDFQRKPKGRQKRTIPKMRKDSFDDFELVSDYAQRIRKARAKTGMNQDKFAQNINEKPSLLRRIESGKAKPTIQLAKKIQKEYNIQLLKEKDITSESSTNYKKYLKSSKGSSLGDIAFIKKKDK